MSNTRVCAEETRASGGEEKNLERSVRTKVKAADGRLKKKVGGVLMIHFNKKSSSALSKNDSDAVITFFFFFSAVERYRRQRGPCQS